MSPIRREAMNAFLIIAGIMSAGMGLKGFLFSSHFIDGGVTGVSMLLSKVTPITLAVWLPVINLPFVLVGYRHLGRAFAIRSALAIIGLAVVIATLQFPDVTRDSLVAAVERIDSLPSATGGRLTFRPGEHWGCRQLRQVEWRDRAWRVLSEYRPLDNWLA